MGNNSEREAQQIWRQLLGKVFGTSVKVSKDDRLTWASE